MKQVFLNMVIQGDKLHKIVSNSGDIVLDSKLTD